MDLPILDHSGELDVEAVNQLPRHQLRDWIFARLHGRDFTVPLDAKQGEPPYLVFVRMYDEVDRDTRAYVRSIVQEFLRDVAQRAEGEDGPEWSSDEIVDLLLLAQHLEEDEFAQPVLHMVREEVFLAEPRDLHVHYWLVQTLVSLGWNQALPEFWVRQLQVDLQEFSVLVFTALSRISPHAAAQVLPRIDWNDDEVVRKMRRALQSLQDTYSRAQAIAAVSRVWGELPPRARDVLSSVYADFRIVREQRRIGLPLSTPLCARMRVHIMSQGKRERSTDSETRGGLVQVIDLSEAQIFMLYHGFGIDREYTFGEIGDTLNVEAREVRKIYSQAIRRVRRHVKHITLSKGMPNVLAYLEERLPVEYPLAMMEG